MLALNDIPETGLRDLLALNLSMLNKLAARADDRPENRGKLLLDTALIHHALETDTDIPALMGQAATALCSGLAARPDTPEASRNPHLTLRYIAVIATFGTPDEAQSLTTLHPHQICAPPRPDHARAVALIDLLRPVLAGHPVNENAVAALQTDCADASASREDRRVILPIAQGLQAIQHSAAEPWNLAIAQITAAHTLQAETGGLRRLPTGLMCLEAMMLARLGLSAGLFCKATSPYLPLHLIGQGTPP